MDWLGILLSKTLWRNFNSLLELGPTGQASGDKEGEYSTSVGERVVTAGEVATGVVLGEEGGSRIG
jgi:hypothetical protein